MKSDDDGEKLFAHGADLFAQKDFSGAVNAFRKAAEKGHTAAQYNLGVCYRSGSGCEKDLPGAVKLFFLAAEKGHVQAQFNLGVAFERGDGVGRSRTEAAIWYAKAADQGHEKAAKALAELKEVGIVAKETAPESSKKELCGWCGKLLIKKVRCSACMQAVYCNPECQVNGWTKHKKVCKKLSDSNSTSSYNSK